MPKAEDYSLRPMEKKDLKKVFEWRNSERIRANMYTDHNISWVEHEKWFSSVAGGTGSEYHILEYLAAPIGFLSIVQIDKNNGKCSWGFYIGDKDAPRGAGSILLYLSLDLIFEKLKIRKLCSEVFAFNMASINLHKKFGFREEGHYIEHVLKNGIYEDVVALAHFAKQFEETKSELEKLAYWD